MPGRQGANVRVAGLVEARRVEAALPPRHAPQAEMRVGGQPFVLKVGDDAIGRGGGEKVTRRFGALASR